MAPDVCWREAICSYEFSSDRVTPTHYLKKGEGRRGDTGTLKAVAKQSDRKPSPPSAGAFRPRESPASTVFRRYYERGDLPVIVVQHSINNAKNALKWQVDIYKTDLNFYLPLFIDGLRETKEPMCFIAARGVADMLAAHTEAIVPVLPQLILPFKRAMDTRVPEVVCTALFVLQMLLNTSQLIGKAIIPYYRQVLPVFNIFISCPKPVESRLCHSTSGKCIGDLVLETLQLLERKGGPQAFMQIKRMVPTYESILRVA